MAEPRLAAAHALVSVSLVGLLSCDRNSESGSPLRPGAGNAFPATIVAVDISGAQPTLPPGSSLQLRAMSLKSDGVREDVTDRATWSTSAPDSLQVSGTGLVTAVGRGEARITARLEARTATATILALPADTFRLSGRITEDGIPVSDAVVEVLSGIGSGLAAPTDTAGDFALYGVAGPIRLHGKKAGYQNVTRDLTVAAHDTVNLSLIAEGSRANIAGQYRLTIGATRCAGPMPSEGFQRSYDASIEQRGPRLTVRLSGAEFLIVGGRGNSFSGWHQIDGRVEFNLGLSGFGYYYYSEPLVPPQIVERLNATTVWLAEGMVRGNVQGDVLRGPLQGTIFTSHSGAPPFTPGAACFSNNHEFELRRRP